MKGGETTFRLCRLFVIFHCKHTSGMNWCISSEMANEGKEACVIKPNSRGNKLEKQTFQ